MPLACSPWRQTRRRVHQSGRGAQGELVVRQWRGAVRAVTRVQRVEMTKRSSWVFVLMAAAILMVTLFIVFLVIAAVMVLAAVLGGKAVSRAIK